MALDQIWKVQLTLVTYGNEFLQQDLDFNDWVNHPVFAQHHLVFRDLASQQLLAQHFQVWLEALKQQGVDKLSLHNSNILQDESNPNANVELLPYAHFIVSHQKKNKTAWICGHELAEWYLQDYPFAAPSAQQIKLRQEIFWRYPLNEKLTKKVVSDLKTNDWHEIEKYIESEIFNHQYAEDFAEPEQQDLPYYGYTLDQSHTQSSMLAIIPTHYQADSAHQLMHRMSALTDFIENQRRNPYSAEGDIISPEQQIDLRKFVQKTDDVFGRLITKIANHYKNIDFEMPMEPYDRTMDVPIASDPTNQHKANHSSVIKLVLITVVICILAYYFGL
ncbi:hypothetical protein [Acinetobacter sp. NIPH 2699]|uniref:hypothetical protein n=1 Tax=Acinetobacter sp. NIPH 2699 TaxID=2923433 RepID=UPI001F4AA700|nr:hypothetical protein [Acinetobacter sp. NIPH 2699]MCH7337516.1 hypothetical protein [Acinetobacter sp. NIPH 2699]